jgi:DNA-directed RNA polymerase specialized sigma24 family protein
MTVPSPQHHPRRAVLGAACRGRMRPAGPGRPGGRSDSEADLLLTALVGTLASLSPRRRQVLALAAMGGLTAPAIAAAMGLSVEDVGVLLLDAVNEVVNRLAA